MRFFIVSMCLSAYAVLFGCASKPTDMRALVSAEALVYLEANDLAATLQPVIDSRPFTEAAARKPDISPAKGVQIAIAVTGFEASTVAATDEKLIGRVKPKFVAIADTHAWDWQALQFAEQSVAQFVAESFDSDLSVGKTERDGGHYFVWSSDSGERAFGFVIGSLVYFANDEAALERCFAIRRGEADSLAKAGAISVGEGLASGRVSADGVSQIANLATAKLANESGEEEEVQSVIAGILPQLVRNSVTGIEWTMTATETGIEDKVSVSLKGEIANVFNETLASANPKNPTLLEYLPREVAEATVYNLSDPQVAWRSVLLTAQKQTDPLAGQIIGIFSGSLFDPYGLRDPELFLSLVNGSILTAKFGDEEKPVVVAAVKDVTRVKTALDIDLSRNEGDTQRTGVEVWTNGAGDISAAFSGDIVILGDSEAVMRCLEAKRTGNNLVSGPLALTFRSTTASTLTQTFDQTTAAVVIDLLAERKSADARPRATSLIETRFDAGGVNRREISDLGVIGWILANIAE